MASDDLNDITGQVNDTISDRYPYCGIWARGGIRTPVNLALSADKRIVYLAAIIVHACMNYMDLVVLSLYANRNIRGRLFCSLTDAGIT